MGFARGFREKYLKGYARKTDNVGAYTSLLNNVNSSAEEGKIDKQSALEISNLLIDPTTGAFGGSQKFAQAQEYFSKAVEGIDPKFKARRQTELLYKTMVDQPGKRQFVFGAGVGGRSTAKSGLLGA